MTPDGRSISELSAGQAGQLVVAIAESRDRDAFAVLFRHFAPRIKTFMMRAGMAPAAAEELAQETMLAVWQKASYFDGSRAGAATWIFTIARNLRIDRFRRQNLSVAPGGFADPSREPEAVPTGEAIALVAERERRVREALALLSEEQAHIVRLAYFGEKPHSMIAAELGIPLGTVKSRIRLAMGRLRVALEDLT